MSGQVSFQCCKHSLVLCMSNLLQYFWKCFRQSLIIYGPITLTLTYPHTFLSSKVSACRCTEPIYLSPKHIAPSCITRVMFNFINHHGRKLHIGAGSTSNLGVHSCSMAAALQPQGRGCRAARVSESVPCLKKPLPDFIPRFYLTAVEKDFSSAAR